MAKFCEIAGQVTNCTDNCKICLEEETETHAKGERKNDKTSNEN